MRPALTLTMLLLFCLAPPNSAQAGNWMFGRSLYSHDPLTGQRVVQYLPALPAYTRPSFNYNQSGYFVRNRNRNIRSNFGDRQMVVETWGNGRGGWDAQSERDFEARQRTLETQGYYWGNWNFGRGGRFDDRRRGSRRFHDDRFHDDRFHDRRPGHLPADAALDRGPRARPRVEEF